jgi:hypothetical protein
VNRPKVITFKQLPTRFPATSTIAWWLLLDRFHVPGWCWGMWGTVWVLLWIAMIFMAWQQRPTPLKELE